MDHHRPWRRLGVGQGGTSVTARRIYYSRDAASPHPGYRGSPVAQWNEQRLGTAVGS